METRIAAVGLAVFGLLVVVYLTTELAGVFVGREAIPTLLRPLAGVDHGKESVVGVVIGRLLVLLLGQVVVIGVLVSGIANRDPIAELLLVAEVVASTLWVGWLAIIVSSRRN